MRGLLYALGGFVLAALALRLLKLSVWLLLRPGGWAVLAAGALVALAATRG